MNDPIDVNEDVRDGDTLYGQRRIDRPANERGICI